MKNPPLLALLGGGLLTLLTACGGSSSPSSPTSKAPSVYVAGAYLVGSEYTACYWKDGVRTDLPGIHGAARAIFVDADGKVFTAGETKLGSDTVACYWTGTTRTDLPDDRYGGSVARGIVVENGVVYTAGSYRYEASTQSPCYWVDASFTSVSEWAAHSGVATGIALDAGRIFISGTQFDGAQNVAKGWRIQGASTAIYDLQDGGLGSTATSVAVFEGRPYFGGQAYTGACYWSPALSIYPNYFQTDSICQSLSIKANSSSQPPVVYGAGTNTSGPCTWAMSVLSEPTALPHSTSGTASASGVFIYPNTTGSTIFGTVYATGSSYEAATGQRACYWKDGAVTFLPSGTNASYGYAIVVK